MSWRPRDTTGCAKSYSSSLRTSSRRGTSMSTPSAIEPAISTAIQTPGLSRDAVISLSEGKNEPDWLRESRLAGWQAFEELPLPRWTKGIAQWWTTDVSELDLSKLEPYAPANRSRENAASLAGLSGEAAEEGSLLVQINSETAYLHVPETVKAQGVIFC